MDSWLPFVGTLIAALMAAIIAVYQTRRNASAQRELEREKLLVAQRSAELAEERQRRTAELQQRSDLDRQYRQAQVLPFLDRLANFIDVSYQVAYAPPYLPEIGGHLPALRNHADTILKDFFLAFSEMARNRAQLFLALRPQDSESVGRRLIDLVAAMHQMLEARHNLWYRAETTSGVWEAHRRFIDLGYGVMLEIQRATRAPLALVDSDEDEEAVAALGATLSEAMEKLSNAAIPYGSKSYYAWTALWECNLRPSVAKFIESWSGVSHEHFVEQWKKMGGELSDADPLELHMGRIGSESDEELVYWLFVSFSSPRELHTFRHETVGALRGSYRALWSSHRKPVEIWIGQEDPQPSE